MDKNVYPEAEIEEFIQKHGDKLSEREKDIIRLRRGLIDGRNCSRTEVAMIMGVKPDRIYTMERMIISKCGRKSAKRRKKISDFYT